MIFNTAAIIASVLAATAIALPADSEVQRRAETQELVENFQYAAQSSECSFMSCGTVIANAGCIIKNAKKKGSGKRMCGLNALGDACGCGTCVHGLEDALIENDIC